MSHSKRRTRRRFLPNLCDVSLLSDTFGRTFKFKITAAALRTVDHRGGLDKFLLKAKDAELSKDALKLKKDLKKKLAADESGAADTGAAESGGAAPATA